jgi:hypothetical protein
MDAGDSIIGVVPVGGVTCVSYEIVERHYAIRTFYVWRACLEFFSQRVHVAVDGGLVYWQA